MDFDYDSGSISNVLILDPLTSALTVAGTQGIVLPNGSTATRPSTPAAGTMRFNTDSSITETWNGASWTTYLASSPNLVALSALSGTGFVTQTGAGTFAERTFQGTAGQIVITNANGGTGDPTVSLATTSSEGTYTGSVTVDAYGRVTSGTNTQAWSTITDTPTTLAGYGITNSVTNLGNASTLQAGTFASRPAFGNLGHIYFATDTNAIYYDAGTQWSLIQPTISGDVSIPGGTTTATLSTTGVIAGSGYNTFTVDAKGRLTAASTTAYLTGNQSISLNGDVTGTGTTSITTTLADSGVVAGQYTKVTVDSKGRVTIGGSLSSSDVTGALGYTPISTAELGQPDGVATLDAGGKLTASQIPDSLIGAVVYQGTWDASTNTPTLVSGVGTKGQYYKVSVAGNTTLDGNTNWTLGDVVIFNGTVWEQIQGGSSDVVSVFGRVGAVVLLDTDVTAALGYTPYDAANPAGYISANQNITISGDATGSGTTSIPLTLASVGTAGTYVTVTTDVKGRVTSGSTTQAWSTLTGTPTTISGYGITDAYTKTEVDNHTWDWSAITSEPTTLAGYGITDQLVYNAGGTPSMQTGTLAARPAAGTAGRLYITTDTNMIYRDTGSAWTQVGEAGLLYTENAVSPTDSVVSGANSASIGSGNTAAGANSFATGSGSKTAIAGADVRANGSFSAAGDAQSGKYILRNSTTTNVTTELFTDGASGRLVLPNNTTWSYSIQIAGRRTDATGNNAGWKIEGVVSRDGNAASTALVGTRSKTVLTRPNNNWNAEVSVDTTNGALIVRVTGENSKTIRWVATVTTTEIAN